MPFVGLVIHSKFTSQSSKFVVGQYLGPPIVVFWFCSRSLVCISLTIMSNQLYIPVKAYL